MKTSPDRSTGSTLSRGESNDRRRWLFAFTPYLVLSLTQLVVLYTGPSIAVPTTKALLMPLLVLAVVLSLRGARDSAAVRPPALLIVAIAFSWVGDVVLSFPDWFAIGLAAFLIAHVAYCALFLRLQRESTSQLASAAPQRRRPSTWAIVVAAVWFAAFLWLLAPYAGDLLVAIVLYGIVLGSMAVLASMHGTMIALGGALFVVSDSVLALGKFLPGYEFAVHDFAVMSTYLAAQGLIALGVVQVTSATSGRR